MSVGTYYYCMQPIEQGCFSIGNNLELLSRTLSLRCCCVVVVVVRQGQSSAQVSGRVSSAAIKQTGRHHNSTSGGVFIVYNFCVKPLKSTEITRAPCISLWCCFLGTPMHTTLPSPSHHTTSFNIKVLSEPWSSSGIFIYVCVCVENFEIFEILDLYLECSRVCVCV